MRSKGGSSKGSVLGCMNGLSAIAEILAVFCPGASPGTRAEAEKVAARTPKYTSLMVSPQICPAEPPQVRARAGRNGILHGHGNLVPGLERELSGKGAGDKLQVTVSPADGYGEYDQALVQRVPRRALKGLANLRVGMRLEAQTGHGARAVIVTQIMGDMLTLDGNHPLAGKNLHFQVEVAGVRAATDEELSHGHVHGPGGHHQ